MCKVNVDAQLVPSNHFVLEITHSARRTTASLENGHWGTWINVFCMGLLDPNSLRAEVIASLNVNELVIILELPNEYLVK
jgi:hypothetical protein